MNNMLNQVNLKNCIAPSFYNSFWAVWDEMFTHYWEKGGRGSVKSSFISQVIILKIMDDGEKGIMSNALAIRRVKDTLKDSVYEQFVWAIDKLKCGHLWDTKSSPLKLIYIPTGQQILFRGMDKPKKLKSTKVSKGWIKYIWYEEVDEIESYDKIRIVNQSLLRGGKNFLVFYSFNPPQSQRNWVNMEVLEKRKDKYVNHTTYLTVPKEWLGEQFIIEAEHLKKINPSKYNHDYLGEVTGTGLEVFTNITIRTITDEEISIFDRVKRGMDFGYGADPLTYMTGHYDKRRKKLYLFGELYKRKLGNSSLASYINKENPYRKQVICDSAEPRTINELRLLGVNAIGAKKGPDSVEYGIKFLSEEIEEIIIDPVRCPNAKREFLGYEIEVDKEGNPKGSYPDKNNHTIDAVRYMMENDMTKRTKTFNRDKFGI